MSFCIDCLEDFRDDDTGGYNPACECGAHCRDCHDAAAGEGEYAGEDDLEPCEQCGEMDWVSPCYACRVKVPAPSTPKSAVVSVSDGEQGGER